MVLWQVDRDKWQREKDLLNWEGTAGEEQGGSSSIKGCVLLSQFSKGAGSILVGEKRRQQNRQEKGS